MLFNHLKIREVTLNNRLVVSPMCEYSSKDGFANDWHLVHLGSRAVGGAGLIFTEACAVSPEGRITPDDLGIWKDEHVSFLKRIVDFVHAYGATAGIQLAHAGRKASHTSPWKGNKLLAEDDAGGWKRLAPSAVPYRKSDPHPSAMSLEDIHQLKEDFRAAAGRALAAGFKVFEIHAAHGYLLHEFLSPLSNIRNDDYGGSFENRCRLLLEISDDIRNIIGDQLALFVRISATDWVEGGWNIEHSIKLSRMLKRHSVDLIDCSSGGNAQNQQIPVEPLYQVPFAQQIKKEAEIMTGAVGLITTPGEAQNILVEQKADLIFIGRESLRDPYFPLHAAKKLGVDVDWPVQYQRAKI